MKKQKHFESEQAIIDAIHHVKARHALLTEEAVRLEHARRPIGAADEDRLLRINKSSRRIEDVTLPKLKRTLAAFRTEPMPFSDKSVVLQ